MKIVDNIKTRAKAMNDWKTECASLPIVGRHILPSGESVPICLTKTLDRALVGPGFPFAAVLANNGRYHIIVNQTFLESDREIKKAILLHEEAHIVLGHLEKAKELKKGFFMRTLLKVEPWFEKEADTYSILKGGRMDLLVKAYPNTFCRERATRILNEVQTYLFKKLSADMDREFGTFEELVRKMKERIQ